MAETDYFVLLTAILFLIGFIMPFLTDIHSTPDLENYGGDYTLNYLDFIESMFKAYFWYYPDMPVFANTLKGMLNFIWLYLGIRLIRGGG